MSHEILLKDILDGIKVDSSANRRRKLRFNTSWIDQDTKIFRDFRSMYMDNDECFVPWTLSTRSNKQKRLSDIDTVFQFIEIEPHKWLFVGAYEIIDLNLSAFDKVIGKPFDYANAKRLAEFDKLSDRLVVEHTNTPKKFFYTDPNIIDNVKVYTILPRPYRGSAEEFPGYENVCKDYKALSHCIKDSAWHDALCNVYGVYVLTDTKTGKLYIGSATGADGIYGRWQTYLKRGYDDSDKDYPNKKLKELVKKEGIKYIQDNFQYSILEIFPKTDIGCNKALERESYWKNVFKTRMFGYNDN